MTVSSITGRRERRWLQGAMGAAVVLAVCGLLLPDSAGSTAAGLAVFMIIITPLARVIWIIYRLACERDRRFVLVGVSLLSVVTFGVAISLFLRG